MPGRTLTIYITRYATTHGVIECQGTTCGDGTGVVVAEYENADEHYHLGEWYETREEALLDAKGRIGIVLAQALNEVKRLETLNSGLEAELYKRGVYS